jgi:two-component sensor histidine kinase
MLAGAVELIAARPKLPRWMSGKRTALHLAGAVMVALTIFGLSALVTGQNLAARSWVGHSREVQLAIDRVVWDQLSLQQAMQAQQISRDPEQLTRFNRFRSAIRQDVDRLRILIADNPQQQKALAEFDVVTNRYLVNVGSVAGSEMEDGTGQVLAPAISIDANRMSRLIGGMRDREDALLRDRTDRANRLFAALLPTLGFSAVFFAVWITMAALSINRRMRGRDRRLAAQACEIVAQAAMMREVDQRVRNSLELVYNLMNFQRQRADSTGASRDFLADVANQLLVVARLHERLYKPGATDRLQIGEYLRDLCDDISTYSLPQDWQGAIRVQAVETEVTAEHAVWLGWIVVEFVTNALKYAHPTEQAPILIDVAANDGRLLVSVADQGEGLPASFDLHASKGLGMQVAGLLVRQLRGTLGIDRGWAGARFVVNVPMMTMTAAS